MSGFLKDQSISGYSDESLALLCQRDGHFSRREDLQADDAHHAHSQRQTRKKSLHLQAR